MKCIKTIMRFSRVAQILQKCTNLLHILGSKRVTRSKIHTEDPLILGATVKNQVSRATLRTGLSHSWCKVHYCPLPLDTRIVVSNSTRGLDVVFVSSSCPRTGTELCAGSVPRPRIPTACRLYITVRNPNNGRP